MPLSISNSLFDREAIVIKEEIGSAAMSLLPATDPIFRDMILGAMRAGVEFGQTIGRDMLMKKRFYTGLAGVIRGGNIANFQQLYGGQTNLVGTNLQLQQLGAAWPSPFSGPAPKPFGLTSTLYAVDTNLPLSLTMLQLDALKANIQQQVTPILKGFARNIALWAANSWHMDSSKSFRLGSLGATSGTGAYTIDTSAKTITFYPTEKATHRFAVGQRVDIYSGTTLKNVDGSAARQDVYITLVSPWQNKVVIASPSTDTNFATWATTGNIGASAFVTYAEIRDATWGFRGLYNWRSWAVWGDGTTNGNRILRDLAITTTTDDYIDVTQHSEFESGHFGAFGVLTERKLIEVLETAETALRPYGYFLDTVFASRGVFVNAFAQYQSLEEYERQGQVGSLKSLGLQEGFKFTAGDRSYEGYTSLYMETGTMLGLRRKGNWALVTPPKPQGLQRGGAGVSDEELDSVIPLDFVMPALGHSSAAFPVLKANTTTGEVLNTEHMMLPGQIKMQFMPIEQIPMMVLDGVTESRTYSAA